MANIIAVTRKTLQATTNRRASGRPLYQQYTPVSSRDGTVIIAMTPCNRLTLPSGNTSSAVTTNPYSASNAVSERSSQRH